MALVVGLALCTIVFAAGYWAFSKQFETQYDSSIRSIASAARECLHPDDFKRYLDSGEKDSAYMQTFAILQDFVDKFDLNLLYVSKVEPPDYTRITYIFNPVRKGGRWSEYPLGYFETYEEPEYNSSAKRVFEQGAVIVRHTEKTRSGSHITAMYPVMDSAGKVVAVIGVQKSIQEYVSARYSFVNFVVTTEIVFALLLVLLFSSFFNRRVIDPIMLVTQEASQFVSRGGEPSDKLLSLKNRDELRTLAESVHRMETDIKKHIEELSRVTAEKERFETELGIASRIQVAMLPKVTFPDRADFDLFATMTPAKEVGGDLYDYFLIDDDHLLLVVGGCFGQGHSGGAVHGRREDAHPQLCRAANEPFCHFRDDERFDLQGKFPGVLYHLLARHVDALDRGNEVRERGPQPSCLGARWRGGIPQDKAQFCVGRDGSPEVPGTYGDACGGRCAVPLHRRRDGGQ